VQTRIGLVWSSIFLLFTAACTTRAQTVLLLAVKQPGMPPSVVAPDANGQYRILPSAGVIVQFTAPLLTGISVAVDGDLLQAVDRDAEGTKDALEGQDLGYYFSIDETVDVATGLVTRELAVAPPPSKRKGPELEIQIENISFDATHTGYDLVSPPVKIHVVRKSAPAEATPEWAAANGGPFLTFGYGPNDYYRVIDPNDQKTTFFDWRQVNGFNPVPDGTDDPDAQVIFYNAADLGATRNVAMKKMPNGDLAYYIKTFNTLEGAIRQVNPTTIEAIDYSAVSPGGGRFLKFYVFDPTDPSGTVPRKASIDFDGRGAKPVPNVCVNCHGAGSPNNLPFAEGDMGLMFVPFVLDNFHFSTDPRFTRAAQEPSFKQMNQGMHDVITNDGFLAAHFAPLTNFINGSYNGFQDTTQVSGFINDPEWATNAGDFYLKVMKPYCRSCHIAMADGPLNWEDYDHFWDWFCHWDQFGFPDFLVKEASAVTVNNIPSARQMPHSLVAFRRFWLSGIGPEFLQRGQIACDDSRTNRNHR
jgi:hypothetical protein